MNTVCYIQIVSVMAISFNRADENFLYNFVEPLRMQDQIVMVLLRKIKANNWRC